VIAADGIDLDVLEGENLAIIGPNGAGKTTFLNISTGYLRRRPAPSPFSATTSPRTAAHDHQARHCPRLPDSAAVPRSDRDGEHADRGRLAHGASVGLRALSQLPEAPEMERLLDLVGVKSYANERRGSCPRAAQAVDIALALRLKPRLLLMDEPTSGVASSEKLDIMDILTKALAKEKVTSVFVEHDMDMVERYANRVAVWNMGKIQKVGTPAEVLADPKVREQVIGI
jgi:branched-chain amino acid transport system ATP-binding protein